jgi:uncharacterized protein (DUF885 family)
VSDVDLALIGDEFIDVIAAAYPATATLIGIHDHDGELGTYTEPVMADLASSLRGLRRRLDGIAVRGLSPAGRIDRRCLAQQIDAGLLEIEGTQWWRRNPDQSVELALSGLFFLMLREFASSLDRARMIESRLRRLPSFLAEARTTLTDSPRVLTETAVQSAEAGAEFLESVIPAWAAELGRDGGHVREVSVAGADELRRHAAWLRDEHMHSSTARSGVGEDLLARIVASHHLLPDTPDDIARRGQTMLERLQDAIATVASGLGYADWRSAAEEVKKDVPAADRLIAAYHDAMSWTEQTVRERGLATVVEGASLEVLETPPFWRHTTPYAAYTAPGAFEQDQRGLFWVTPPDGDAQKLKGHARASIPVVALHEGYPGHHLQLTRANKHPSRVRRLADSSLLIEGWAFYCEEMAHEQGLLTPASRLCQLKDELWRACRVIIDMRLHQGRMTPEEAVEMLVQEADLEPPNARAEVRRYAYTPGYQMSYAIGKQEILRLREQVKRREKAKFSLASFHDRVLDQGSIPTPLVAEAVLAPEATPGGRRS